MNAEAENVAVGMFVGVTVFFVTVFVLLWILERIWRLFNAPVRFFMKTLFSVCTGVGAHYLTTKVLGISVTEGSIAGVVTALVVAFLSRESPKT